jgi:hypothetical protein
MKFEFWENRKPIPAPERPSFRQVKLSVAFSLLLYSVAQDAMEKGSKLYDLIAERVQQRLAAQKYNREMQVWTESNGRVLMMAVEGSRDEQKDLKEIHDFLAYIGLTGDPGVKIVYNGKGSQWIISVDTDSEETMQKLQEATTQLKQQFGAEPKS